MRRATSYFSKCEAILANTAETIVITNSKGGIILSNPLSNTVYIKFNWATGDTEVSLTNFDIALFPSRVLDLFGGDGPVVKNARVICATAGSIGIVGW
jgi:hypothetical protein